MSASKSLPSEGIDEITSGLTRTMLADGNASKKAEKGKGRQTDKKDDAIDALGAAWSSWSLEDDEEAQAQREAKRLQEQTKKEQEDKKRASEIAVAKKESEEYDALLKDFQAHGAKAHEIKRKQRKEEAARQQQLAEEAEAIARAERRAQEVRRMQEEALAVEALAAQAKQEADDRVRLELMQAYERDLAQSRAIALAQANAKEAQWQQQRYEAEQIAQYEIVARQAHFIQLQQRQQEELFLQQQLAEQRRAYPQGEQVAENFGEVPYDNMDTAPEIWASGVSESEMDWEQVKETTPLLADPLVPSSQSAQPQSPLLAGPNEEGPLGGNAAIATDASPATAPVAEPSAGMQTTAALAIETPTTAASGAPVTVMRPPSREATPPPPLAVTPPPTPATTPPPPRVATPSPPRAATPSPPPAPMPAPARSSKKTTKVVFKRAIPNPTLVINRPTISVWSPLGRLLSQGKPIPKAVLPEVLGKRARKGTEDGGLNKKRAKLDGELRLEVGGKRKREAEVFPGNKKAMLGRILGRALAVPGQRFTASLSIALPHTLAPTSTSPNAPSSPPLTTPSPPPPPSPRPSPPPAGHPLPAKSHRGLAEAIELFNDLPTLRAEIEYMRAQRRLRFSQKETWGKKSLIDKTLKRTVTPTSSWAKYRENLSR